MSCGARTSENLQKTVPKSLQIGITGAWSDWGPIGVLSGLFNDFVSFPAASSR